MTGLYIHLPFCEGKCPYCDFYSVCAGWQLRQDYTAAVEAELRARSKGETADSLYFGGGTPTLLECSQMGRLVSVARELYRLPADAEITTEANPLTLTPSKLKGLLQAGINRLSIGVQSGVDSELRALGRKHTAEQAASAIQNAKQAGFSNISIDLMLAIPGQTPSSLAQTMDYTQKLNVSHCSCYLLKLEKNTPFGQSPPDLPSEDQTGELYLQASAALQRMGLEQYEISNFARPGKQCRHNLKYWLGQPYLGFGAAAHSFEKGQRFAHSRSVARYLSLKEQDVVQREQGGDPAEQLMLRLRLTRGVSPKELQAQGFSLSTLAPMMQKLTQSGLARFKDESFCLTPKGFLVQNSVVLYLLEALPKNQTTP